MDKLTMSDWVTVMSALGMVLSVVVAVSALVSKGKSKSAEDAELKSDVKHIRRQVDITGQSLLSLGEKIDGVDTRLTRVEQSCKSAHHRIDTFERKDWS